jgi:ribosomal protein L36
MRRPRTAETIELADAFMARPNGFAAAATLGKRRISVPRAVRIRAGALEWSTEEPGWDHRRTLAEYQAAKESPWRRGHSDDEILRQFVDLVGASDETIAAFAQEFGVLYLGPKGFPGGSPLGVEYRDETVIDVAYNRGLGGGVSFDPRGEVRPVRWHRETLDGWRAWALITRLVLLYGRKLRTASTRLDAIQLLNEAGLDLPPFSDDKDRSYFTEPRAVVASLTFTSTQSGEARQRLTSLAEQRQELAGWLDLLADLSSASVRVTWEEDDRPRTMIGRPRDDDTGWFSGDPNYVFGDVVLQLLTTILGDEKEHQCPDCGIWYPCERRRGFCPHCRLVRRRATRRVTWQSHPEYNERRGKRRSPDRLPNNSEIANCN